MKEHEKQKSSDVLSYGLSPDSVHFIRDAISEGDSNRIHGLIADLHPADVADLINQITAEERQTLIGVIKDTLSAEVLPELEPEVREEILSLLGTEAKAKAVSELESDEALEVIGDLNKEDQKEILEAIDDDEHRAMLEEGLSYSEDAAGRLMNTDFVTVPEDWDVGETIDFLRQKEDLPTDFYQIFVVDKKNIPVASVMVSRVIRSKREIAIKDISDPDLRLIPADMDQEEVGYMFQKYGLAAAPVIDEHGHIVGTISVDDVVHVIEEEAEEDIMRLGGVSETDLYTGFFKTARRRFPWLLTNLFMTLGAASIVGLFHPVIEHLVMLAIFMPIVANMGGNSAIQALTVTVRGLATKELTTANASRVVLKEIFSAMLNGFTLGIIVGVASYLFLQNLDLSLIFAAAMMMTITMGGIVGSCVPILLTKMSLDPAIASSTFLTTITDMAAFSTFLGLATLILL